MNWLMLFFAMAAICIVTFIIAVEKQRDWSMIISAISFIVLLFAIITFAAGSIITPDRVAAFERQKEYIENHDSQNPTEDAALTSKKIELNQWLFRAQASKERFGGWSFYPESILDFEPIQ